MRRWERQVMDPDRIEDVIRACHCCRLGLYDGGRVYIVPLNFGYENNQGKRWLYFHSASKGRKIDLLKTGQTVGFEMDTNYQLQYAAEACGYSAKYASVIGAGTVSFLKETDEKVHALQQIMLHYTGKADWTFPDKALSSTCLFRLEVTELSCKAHE